ncbi:sulfurtransferase TusA [Allohahella marinimesophila]|uniref:Sulfurtransferase TusA n=1 Tax=Allohahella marinimesophila TaxID=1054972 RepID=A0ABP7NM93_9GAMM
MDDTGAIYTCNMDLRGMYCPEPVMKLHELIRTLQPGDTILVRATDPATQRDIPKFCLFLGHELCESHIQQEENEFHYVIRLGSNT